MRQEYNHQTLVEQIKTSPDIGEDMAVNADLLAYYGYQEVLWISYCDQIKYLIDNKTSDLDLEIRETAEKITEATVKAKIANDSDLRKLNKTLITAKETKSLYSNAVRAIEQKGKLLQSKGAYLRSEMDNLGMHTPASKEAAKQITPEERSLLLKRLGSTR